VGCLAKQECVDDVYMDGPPTPHEKRMSLRIIINIPNLMVGFMNNMRSSSKKSSLYLMYLKDKYAIL
jgi:hypothetical protein